MCIRPWAWARPRQLAHAHSPPPNQTLLGPACANGQSPLRGSAHTTRAHRRCLSRRAPTTRPMSHRFLKRKSTTSPCKSTRRVDCSTECQAHPMGRHTGGRPGRARLPPLISPPTAPTLAHIPAQKKDRKERPKTSSEGKKNTSSRNEGRKREKRKRTASRSSTKHWSYPLRLTRNRMEVTSWKQWIHLRRSDFWPPTWRIE